MSVGSRLLPLVLATAALAAGTVGLGGLALWLGLLAVPAAAASAFVAVSDALEGLRPALLRAWTSGLALALVVLASAARENTAAGAPTSRLATWALVFALLAYLVPVVAWVLQPVRLSSRTQQRRRLRPAEVDELLSRAA
jgi:hypothetical protein